MGEDCDPHSRGVGSCILFLRQLLPDFLARGDYFGGRLFVLYCPAAQNSLTCPLDLRKTLPLVGSFLLLLHILGIGEYNETAVMSEGLCRACVV